MRIDRTVGVGTLDVARSDGLLTDAHAAGQDPVAGIELARRHGSALPLPGQGDTVRRWRMLAEVAAVDLTAGRIFEAHSDALAILAEAGHPRPDGTWGVFAAEAPGVTLSAAVSDAQTTLTGTKPWCSLAGRLEHALVTARVGDQRQLFAVDLQQESVTVDPAREWVARGLRNVPSGPVHFQAAPGRPVGLPGWYLARAGFAWGGIGVAACWYGGATALATRLARYAGERGDELSALALGKVDAALSGARAILQSAATVIDAGSGGGAGGSLLALRVRAVVADAVELTLTQVGHALGPAALAFDEEHARRVADLALYVRQHHAERDLMSLGRAALDGADDALL